MMKLILKDILAQIKPALHFERVAETGNLFQEC